VIRVNLAHGEKLARRLSSNHSRQTGWVALARIFGTANPLLNLAPTWNMAPTRDVPVIRLSEQGERHLVSLRWGLVASFTNDFRTARKPINARAETVATSGMFRDAFARRRRLVPAPVYYEWRDDPDGKVPFAVARVDGAPSPSPGSRRPGDRPRGRGCRPSPS
jgi:putative SOS response-associated peptidase YedK